MIRLIRDFRFVPLVLVATISLFVLKTFGLVFDGGYTLNELARRGADEGDVTGSVGAQRRVDLSADDPRLVQPAPASRPPARRRLTVELAARAKDKDKPSDLPKIEGKPMTN